MHRSVGSALLVVFAFALAGIYPLQWQLRMAARLHMHAVVRVQGRKAPGTMELTFPASHGRVNDHRFAWEEKDEFSVDGRMYDVISWHMSGGTITFLCVPDAEEDALIVQARRSVPINGADGRVPASLLRSIVGVYLPATMSGRIPAALPSAHPFPVTEDGHTLAGFDRALLRPPASALSA